MGRWIATARARPVQAFLLGWAVVAAGWAGLAFLVGPGLIRWAHAGTAPGFLSVWMAGFESTPLEEYLGEWRTLMRSAWYLVFNAGVVGLATAWVWVRTRDVDSGESTARFTTWMGIVAFGAWIGLAAGLAEGYWVATKVFYLHEVTVGFVLHREAPWMAAAADAMLVGGGALLLWLVGGVWRPARSVRVAATALVFLGLLSVFGMTGRLAAWAAAILAAGVAVNAGRYAARHWDAFPGLMRRSGAWMIGATALVASLTAIPELLQERRMLGSLPAPEPDRPNVLLLVMDTERAQNMQLYGYDRPTTPELDTFGDSAVVFDWALAPGTWTLTSHASMFTGRWPTELGVDNLTPLDDTWPTLAEVMTREGYATAGFIANVGFMGFFYGAGRGFGRWEDHPRSLRYTLFTSWLFRTAKTNVRRSLGMSSATIVKPAEQVVDDFLEWRADLDTERPWFAFLNFMEVHQPHYAEPPYDTLFADPGALNHFVHGLDEAAYEPSEIEDLVDTYDGSTAYLDHQLGVLLDSLRAADELANTVVIVTSDHGEEYGEYGVMGHQRHTVLPVLHVPLLIRDPRDPAAVGRIETPVSLRDLPRTVMELLDVEDHPFPGFPLPTLWSDDPAAGATAPPVLSEEVLHKSLVYDGIQYVRSNEGVEMLVSLEAPDVPMRLDPEREAALLERFRALLASTYPTAEAYSTPPEQQGGG